MGKIINALIKKIYQKEISKLKSIDFFTPFFSGCANPKLNDTFMACCQAHARYGAKFKPVAYVNNEPAKKKKHITDLLTLRPNDIMNGPTLWEKVTENYFEVGNVFLFLDYDWTDYKAPLKAIYALDPDENQMEVRQGDDKKIYIRFSMQSVQYTVSLDQIVHIARNVNNQEFFGTDNKAIERVLKVISTNYEGIEQAIKTSAFLRFIVQMTTPMIDSVKEQKTKYFAEQYLGKNATGIAYIDGAEQIIQVNSKAKYANADEMEAFEDKIYSFLGINKKIIQASANEDEIAAYYESSLQPLVLKLEAELTYKLFSAEDRAKTNEIKIDANRLHSASIKTRVSIAEIIQKLPVYVPNVINELLFLPKTENGDNEYSTLNYVKANEQSQYQGTTPVATPKNNDKKKKEEAPNAANPA